MACEGEGGRVSASTRPSPGLLARCGDDRYKDRGQAVISILAILTFPRVGNPGRGRPCGLCAPREPGSGEETYAADFRGSCVPAGTR